VLDPENLYGLSHGEQKILIQCKEVIAEKGPFSATEIQERFSEVSLPGWMKRLKKFCDLGLLKKEHLPDSFGPVWKYDVGAPEKVVLNPFNQLDDEEEDAEVSTPEEPLDEDKTGSPG